MFSKILLALSALLAGNAFAQSSFSVYFNGESTSANCHVDGVSNAQLSTTGNGNLVATAATPLAFSSACGISGNAQQLTYGPAQPLIGPASTLAAGSNVAGGFSVLPLNAASCTAAIATTSGSGTVTPGSLNVCGFTGKPSCTGTSPIAFNASFTNTGTGPSTYQATVTCLASSGASPASLPSNTVTINQSGNSGGTPVANFTFVPAGLTVAFTDTSTDLPNGTLTWAWNFGETGSGTNTSTLKNPSHTYAAAGTYTVSLIVTDTVNNAQDTSTQPVTVSTGTDGCPTIAGTGAVTNFTRWTGKQSVYYFGSGANTGSQSVDVTSYAAAWFAVWPGEYGRQGVFPLPTSNYMAQKLTVPNPYFVGAPSNLYGRYSAGSTQNDALFSMTISTKCGDFSNPSTYPTTSSVVPGCYINKAASGGFLQWSKTNGCTLSDGQTYYWNVINADISAITPTGGTAVTTKTSSCGSYCRIPVTNAGNFNTYHP